MLQILLYSLISPIIWLIIIPLAFLTKKGRERLLSERAIRRDAFAKLKQKREDKSVVIFHAASAGEFEQLKPILPLVDKKKIFIFQTFASPTIYRKEAGSDLFDTVCYHPVDSFISALLFFKRVKPDLYVLNRHDLWPAHLFAAKILGIKTVLINANMHEKSGRYFFLFRPLNRWMFNSLSLILCGSERIKSGVLKLASKAKVEISGESRFDQVLRRKESNKKDHFKDDIMNKRNIVLGSIIPSDYDVVFGGIRSYLNEVEGDDNSIRVIAVPHEVGDNDISLLEECLNKFDFTHHRYSDTKKCNDSDVVIINAVGILPELYAYANVAYVGAGFGAGVHNVIEPAVYGVPTFFGPNFHILDEAVEMKSRNVGTVISSVDDVSNFLKLMSIDDKYKSLSEETSDFVKSVAASSQKIVNRIVEQI